MASPIRSDRQCNDEPALFTQLIHELRDAAVFLIDLEGQLASWNPGVGSLLGYTEAEWVGRPVDMIFTPEDRAKGRPRNEIEEAARNGSAADARWHQRKDGSRIFVDGLLHALRAKDRTLLGFAKLMKDATERQKAQELLETTLESISDAFYAIDAEFRFTYVNRKAEELWRRNRQQLIGRHLWTEFPEAVGSHSYNMHLKAMTERVPVQFETVSPVLGRWIDISLYPDARGGLSCYFRDIEQRKRDEERVQQLTRALDQAQIIVRTLDGTIQFWSAGCERLYGYSRADAIGKCSHELLATEFPAPLENIEAELLAAGAWHGELRHRTRGRGVIACESDWILHRPEGGAAVIIEANTDITAQKRIQDQLRIANNELRSFSHAVSHDLQSPLRMVRSYAELLSRYYQPKLDKTAGEFLRFIVQGASNMDALIQSLLKYAEVAEQELTKQSVRVEAIVRAVLIIMQLDIEETEAEIAFADLPEVDADPVQLQQVFQNLIGNAIKYRDPGRRPYIRVAAEARLLDWLFSVQDNGIGIDRRYQERIFEPLKRLHGPEIAGSGIGLAVCSRIVERHGGRIWVESEPGRGSTFFFTLPKA